MGKKSKTNGLKQLIRQVQSDDEEDMPVTTETGGDPSEPWKTYLNMLEEMSTNGGGYVYLYF
jgi:hypothetical protein